MSRRLQNTAKNQVETRGLLRTSVKSANGVNRHRFSKLTQKWRAIKKLRNPLISGSTPAASTIRLASAASVVKWCPERALPNRGVEGHHVFRAACARSWRGPDALTLAVRRKYHRAARRTRIA